MDTRWYNDVTIGMEIGPLVKGPMSVMHIMRWSAAMENFHRIHYDYRFATQHDGLPDIVINGSWKQHVMVQLMKDWLGHNGWLWKISFQFRAMDLAGDTLSAWGRVTDTYEEAGLGFVTCSLGLRNQEGRESTPGTA